MGARAPPVTLPVSDLDQNSMDAASRSSCRRRRRPAGRSPALAACSAPSPVPARSRAEHDAPGALTPTPTAPVSVSLLEKQRSRPGPSLLFPPCLLSLPLTSPSGCSRDAEKQAATLP